VAGKSDTSATSFAQKKLLGKAHTSNLKIDGEEVIGSNVQTSTSLIFGEKIPDSPSQTLYLTQSVAGLDPATGAPYTATVEYIQFVLTALTGTTYDANVSGGGSGTDAADLTQSAGPHAYKFVLPSNYQSLTSNSRSGNGIFNNNKLVHESLGQLQLVPPFYSQTAPNPYIVKIYKDNGAGAAGDEIPLLDNIDWNVDSYNGILFLQDYVASKIPAFARAFAYIGKMANEVISSGSTGGSASGDSNATYLLLSSTGSLGSARVFTPGTGIKIVDGGSGNNYTTSIDDSIVATVSGSTFSGITKHNAGLSGSLTKLTDGTSYLIAGNNISISSASNGAITITSTAISSPSGVSSQVQFNDNGSLGSDSGFTYDKNDKSLFVSGAILVNSTSPTYGEIFNINQILTSSADLVRVGSYIKQTLTGSFHLAGGDQSFLYGLVVETYNKSKLFSGYGIVGSAVYAQHQSTSSIDTVWGQRSIAKTLKPNNGNIAGAVSSLVGSYSEVGYVGEVNFSGSIIDSYGFKYSNDGINSARTVLNSYGIQLQNIGATFGVTNAIGIDIEQINTASGTKLGIRTQDPIVIGTTNVNGTEKLRVNGTSHFDGVSNFIEGLSGSITRLTNGNSYIVAGTGVSVVSSSSGQITISNSAVQTIEWSEKLAGTVDGTNTNFALNYTPTSSSTIMVFLNGILLEQGVNNDFTISGTTVTLTEAPLPDSKIIATYSR